MKTTTQLLLVILLLFALMYVLSAVAGLLFWAIVATGIIAVIGVIVGGIFRERKEKKTPGRMAERRTEKAADRALKELERKVNK